VRRALTLGVGGLVVLAGIVGLLLFAQSRDEPGVSADAGDAPSVEHGASAPAVDAGDLPTSGTHKAVALGRDATDLTGDEWLHALEEGNVILAYGADEPGDALERVQEDLAGPFDPELAAAGQSVVLAHVDGLADYAAVAWGEKIDFQDPAAPEVREFVEARLGTGAPR
jgi:hypothetical protein